MDKEIKYKIDRSLLKPGDVVLTSEKSPASVGVRVATISRYSHAAIFVGDTLIEATLDGVFSKNVQRLIFKRKTDALVLRSRSEVGEHVVSEVCSYARSKVGSLYALGEAITFKIRSALNVNKGEGQFCSRLIAEAYANAGYDLINIRTPSFCTPRQLQLCKAFYPLENVIVEASQQEIDFSKTPDPNIEHQRHTFDWLNKARDLALQCSDGKEKIQTISDVNSFIIRYPDFSANLEGYLTEGGYLYFYSSERKKNPYRYDEQLFLCKFIESGYSESFIFSEIEKEERMFGRFSTNFYHFMDLYLSYGTGYFYKMFELYLNILKEMKVRIDVIAHAVDLTDPVYFGRKLFVIRDRVDEVLKKGDLTIEN